MFFHENQNFSFRIGEFAKIQVKGADGVVRDYLWLEAFYGSETLREGAADRENKNILVVYQTRDFYDPASGDYKMAKVVKEINWQ